MSVLWVLAPFLVLAAAEPPSNYLNDFEDPRYQFQFQKDFHSPNPFTPSAPYTSRYLQPPSSTLQPQQSYGVPSSTQKPIRTPVYLPVGSPTSSVHQFPTGSSSPPTHYNSPRLSPHNHEIQSVKTTLQPPAQQSHQAQSSQSYGIPHIHQTYGIPSTSYGVPDFSSSYDHTSQNSMKVVKHISVFIAPDEPSNHKPRTIRVKGEQEKHVNIIFIKSPNPPKPVNAEIELPPAPEQKTLVYVLSKAHDETPEIKFTSNPNTVKQAAPDVYFIRYKSAPKDRYGVPHSDSNSEYENLYSSFQQSDYSNPEPVMVNGHLPTDDVSNYAPKMDHNAYNFISKRETSSGEKGVVNLNVSDFRPYSYAPKLTYAKYQVKGY